MNTRKGVFYAKNINIKRKKRKKLFDVKYSYIFCWIKKSLPPIHRDCELINFGEFGFCANSALKFHVDPCITPTRWVVLNLNSTRAYFLYRDLVELKL